MRAIKLRGTPQDERYLHAIYDGQDNILIQTELAYKQEDHEHGVYKIAGVRLNADEAAMLRDFLIEHVVSESPKTVNRVR